MKTNNRRNIIDNVLDEYIVWGGPIVQRRVALQDMQDRGFDAKAIDISVFGRNSVPAPIDAAAHLDFFRRIQMAEAMRQAVAA